MASPFWGLYEDLPPPSTGATAGSTSATSSTSSTSTTTPTTGSSTEDLSEWGATPILAKMMPTAVRKKGVPMVPRSTYVKPKPNTQSNSSKTNDKSTENPTKPPEKSEKAPDKINDNQNGSTNSITASDKAREDALALVSAAYASESSTTPMEVEEEYDPARPNEYDGYLSERIHRSKLEKEDEAKKDRDRDIDRDRDKDRERERDEIVPKVDLNISGEEAFNRRARLSGRAASPPRSVLPPPTLDDDDIDGEELEPTPSPYSNPSGAPKESVAARMMAKMGWREGSGLGREEQGMTTALMHKKTDRRTGIIVNAPPAPTAKPARAPARVPPPTEQSRVLLLKNMVGPGEVDDELESETGSECGKYGEVVKCMIYEVMGGVVGPTEAVRIFIQFARQEAALKAYIDLNGRFFGGRVVNASFYSEERFHANDLAPNSEEIERGRRENK